VSAVEHLGDLIDALGAWSGVPSGRPQVNVRETTGHLMNGHPGLQAVGCPAGPQRVWVGEPVGDAGGRMAAHKPVDRDGRQFDGSSRVWRPRRTNSGSLSRRPTPRASGWTFHASSACCTASGTGTSVSRPPLPRTNSRKCRALDRSGSRTPNSMAGECPPLPVSTRTWATAPRRCPCSKPAPARLGQAHPDLTRADHDPSRPRSVSTPWRPHLTPSAQTGAWKGWPPNNGVFGPEPIHCCSKPQPARQPKNFAAAAYPSICGSQQRGLWRLSA
jgi:hypothetical protein